MTTTSTKPSGQWRCRACSKVWDGSELFASTRFVRTWTCGDLFCGATCDPVPTSVEVSKIGDLFDGLTDGRWPGLYLVIEFYDVYLSGRDHDVKLVGDCADPDLVIKEAFSRLGIVVRLT